MKVQLRLYCTCGAAWKSTTALDAAVTITDAWVKNHSGEGHAECDAKTAARNRRKAERLQGDGR